MNSVMNWDSWLWMKHLMSGKAVRTNGSTDIMYIRQNIRDIPKIFQNGMKGI